MQCSADAAQRALCVAAMLVLMAGFFSTALRLLVRGCRPGECVAPGRGCCRRHHRSDGDSSAASSEEDAVGSGDARLQRCVRGSAANLLVDGDYGHLAKVDACAARGADALAAGATPAAAADVVAACADAEAFPAAVLPFVADFKDCVKRALT